MGHDTYIQAGSKIFLGHENFIDEYYDANDLLNQVGFQIDDLGSQVVQERHQIDINLKFYISSILARSYRENIWSEKIKKETLIL